jgi:tetratricopeptide (TPR) repeat protein
MTQAATTFKPENEKTYEALISLIENSQGRLAPIVVGCDDEILRDKVIGRYETEATIAKIHAYRITLGSEPSISSGLAHLKASEAYLQGNGAAVFTVTGAEYLLWIKTHEEDAQSELDKFFGYLQWTREALRQYPYPIVIWVPHRILRQMSQRAPDFWSWRKAVLRFMNEETVPAVAVDFDRSLPVESNSEDSFLPPLEELLEEIQQLEARSPSSASLATLYDKLGQVYARRVQHGKSQNLAQERKEAISAFERAIVNQEIRQDNDALIDSFTRLGNFFYSQSQFSEAITVHQKSLDLAEKLQDKQRESTALGNLGLNYEALRQFEHAITFYRKTLEIARATDNESNESTSLGNLGNTYYSLQDYQQAIRFYQQAIGIKRQIGDKQGESIFLGSLGLTYFRLKEYQRAIDFHQQALNLAREVFDRHGEAIHLGNLGLIYYALEQFERAFEFHEYTFQISRETGDRRLEAASIYNKALTLESLGQISDAIQHFEQAELIYSQIQIEYWAKRCDEEIANLQP